jgi:anti-anti-sigma regulatory factor
VITVSGALSSGRFAEVDRLVLEALERGHHNLVLDVHELSAIEPEALGMLWGALRGVRRRGGTLAAAGAGAALRPALDVLNSGGLKVHDSVPAALSDTEHAGGTT